MTRSEGPSGPFVAARIPGGPAELDGQSVGRSRSPWPPGDDRFKPTRKREGERHRLRTKDERELTSVRPDAMTSTFYLRNSEKTI